MQHDDLPPGPGGSSASETASDEKVNEDFDLKTDETRVHDPHDLRTGSISVNGKEKALVASQVKPEAQQATYKELMAQGRERFHSKLRQGRGPLGWAMRLLHNNPLGKYSFIRAILRNIHSQYDCELGQMLTCILRWNRRRRSLRVQKHEDHPQAYPGSDRRRLALWYALRYPCRPVWYQWYARRRENGQSVWTCNEVSQRVGALLLVYPSYYGMYSIICTRSQ